MQSMQQVSNSIDTLPAELTGIIIIIFAISALLMPLFVIAIYSVLKKIHKNQKEISDNMELIAKHLASLKLGGTRTLEDKDLQ